MLPFEDNVAKLAFLFLIFLVISSSFLTQVLSCQTQYLFNKNLYAKHIIGLLLIFVFIMMEGGWSFNQKLQDEAPVDWSNGNVIDSMVWSFIIYTIFLLTSKMKVKPNIAFYSLIFAIYLINTQRLYWKNRDLITKEQNEKTVHILKLCSGAAVLLFMYGITNYYNYEKVKRGKDFRLPIFFLGKRQCDKL